jgi:uncharacterized damage-inducible protein DinB
MNHNDIATLFDYNYWANGRILGAAAGVTPEQFAAPIPGLSHGGLRGTLVHTLGAEMNWRLRCQEGISPTALLTEAELPTLEAVLARWRAEERAMRAYVASLTDDALLRIVQYKNLKGVPYENALWTILAHVVNHGTQSRSEAAVGLTLLGHSPGDLDLMLFLRG